MEDKEIKEEIEKKVAEEEAKENRENQEEEKIKENEEKEKKKKEIEEKGKKEENDEEENKEKDNNEEENDEEENDEEEKDEEELNRLNLKFGLSKQYFIKQKLYFDSLKSKATKINLKLKNTDKMSNIDILNNGIYIYKYNNKYQSDIDYNTFFLKNLSLLCLIINTFIYYVKKS